MFQPDFLINNSPAKGRTFGRLIQNQPYSRLLRDTIWECLYEKPAHRPSLVDLKKIIMRAWQWCVDVHKQLNSEDDEPGEPWECFAALEPIEYVDPAEDLAAPQPAPLPQSARQADIDDLITATKTPVAAQAAPTPQAPRPQRQAAPGPSNKPPTDNDSFPDYDEDDEVDIFARQAAQRVQARLKREREAEEEDLPRKSAQAEVVADDGPSTAAGGDVPGLGFPDDDAVVPDSVYVPLEQETQDDDQQDEQDDAELSFSSMIGANRPPTL
jgi:hypothetical protein